MFLSKFVLFVQVCKYIIQLNFGFCTFHVFVSGKAKSVAFLF